MQPRSRGDRRGGDRSSLAPASPRVPDDQREEPAASHFEKVAAGVPAKWEVHGQGGILLGGVPAGLQTRGATGWMWGQTGWSFSFSATSRWRGVGDRGADGRRDAGGGVAAEPDCSWFAVSGGEAETFLPAWTL